MLVLTKENYYSIDADREYMSVSQYKNWLACPAKEKARQEGKYVRPQNDSFLVGSYVDCALTTPLLFEAFQLDHSGEIFLKKGDKRAPIKKADEMIARVKRDADAVQLLDGEGQVIITGTIPYRDRCNNIKETEWKGAIDILHVSGGVFVDLKTTGDFEDTWKRVKTNGVFSNILVPWYLEYDYQFQMAVYSRILEQIHGKPFIPVIFGVTKQDPPDIGAWQFTDPEWLNNEIGAFMSADPAGWVPLRPDGSMISGMEAVLMMKRGEVEATRCGKCDYCRSVKKLTIETAKRKCD